jgi:hypothetical protein
MMHESDLCQMEMGRSDENRKISSSGAPNAAEFLIQTKISIHVMSFSVKK